MCDAQRFFNFLYFLFRNKIKKEKNVDNYFKSFVQKLL